VSGGGIPERPLAFEEDVKGVAALALGFLLAGFPAGETPGRILVFSRTTGFRHDSIPDGIAAIRQLGDEHDFSVDATEDPSVFEDATLAPYAAVVFLLTTGDVLGDPQQAAFERFLAKGRGFVGVHSAADTEYDWPWYGELVGAYFKSHPAIQSGSISIADPVHVSTRALPAVWNRTDEWYNFQSSPRGRVHVLATLDEKSYSGGEMGADHPISWCRFYEGGRAWYTALGHTRETYSEPLFLEHLLGGIRFAAGFPELCPGAVRSVQPRR
jgi:type 1 glutamine amidotransferase